MRLHMRAPIGPALARLMARLRLAPQLRAERRHAIFDDVR